MGAEVSHKPSKVKDEDPDPDPEPEPEPDRVPVVSVARADGEEAGVGQPDLDPDLQIHRDLSQDAEGWPPDQPPPKLIGRTPASALLPPPVPPQASGIEKGADTTPPCLPPRVPPPPLQDLPLAQQDEGRTPERGGQATRGRGRPRGRPTTSRGRGRAAAPTPHPLPLNPTGQRRPGMRRVSCRTASALQRSMTSWLSPGRSAPSQRGQDCEGMSPRGGDGGGAGRTHGVRNTDGIGTRNGK